MRYRPWSIVVTIEFRTEATAQRHLLAQHAGSAGFRLVTIGTGAMRASQEVEVHLRGDFESNPRCLIEMTLTRYGASSE